MSGHDARIGEMTVRFHEALARFVQRLESLSEDEAQRTPAGGGWTAAQIGDHVARTNEFFAGLLDGTEPRAVARPGFAERSWSEIAAGVPAKGTAPAALCPDPDVALSEALPRLHRSGERLSAALAALTPDRGSNFIVESSMLGTISLYQVGDWATGHIIRHNQQVKRLLAEGTDSSQARGGGAAVELNFVPIETLLLDAGGVLVFPDWDRVSEALERHEVSVPAAALAAAEPHAKRALDLAMDARTTTDQARGWHYFNLVLSHAGIPLSEGTDAALRDLHRYHMERNLWEVVPPDVPPALDRLRRLVDRLVVVSNANGTLRAHFDRLGLASRFDVVLDSADEGVEKPDPRLFEIALARSGARAETTLHVGDLYHVDIVGARAAGLRAVLLDAANLYDEADCPRVRSLDHLADAIAARAFS